MKLPRFLLLLNATLLAMPAAAKDAPPPPQVTNPWARASIGKIAAAYVTIKIRAGIGDRLIRVTSTEAAKVEIHTHTMDRRGVARMRAVPEVAIPAGKQVVFKPGGLHLMLFGLRTPLKKGGTVPLTLHFAHGGKVRVVAKILGYGARWHGGKGS